MKLFFFIFWNLLKCVVDSRCIRSSALIRSSRQQLSNFIQNYWLVHILIVNNFWSSQCVLTKLSCSHISEDNLLFLWFKISFLILRCVMLISFSQDSVVCDELLFSCQKSGNSRQSSLQEPDELVEVVKRNLLWFSENKDRPKISFSKCILPASIFTGWHGEIWVWVRHEVVELRQLVDDDEWGASWHRSWCGLGQQHQHLQ